MDIGKIPSKHLVVQHNDLIVSKYDLNLSEMRLILEAVHNVEKDDGDFQEYHIDVNTFLQLIDTKNVSEYSRVKEFCKTILGKPLEIPKDDGNYLYCNWFSSLEYNPKKKKINYTFDPKLKPYLIELKDKFTKYDIRILMQFKSFYALRIYMLLKSESWKKDPFEYEIQIEKLREMMKLEKKYKLYGHFKNRVLDIAKKYINEVSDIEIDFQDIKEGRKVVAVKFIVKRKPMVIEGGEIQKELSEMTFKQFKDTIVETYKGKRLCNVVPGYKKDTVISITPAGFLRNDKFGDDLKPDDAKKVWQWLFENQHRVGDIQAIDEIERRLETVIGKTITTEIKNVFGSMEEIQLTIKEVIKVGDDQYKLRVVDPNGATAQTNSSYTLQELENI